MSARTLDKVPLEPRHVLEAARVSQETLRPAADRDWSTQAGDLDWDCRRTLDHIVDAPMFYATNLAMRSTQRLPNVRAGAPQAPIAQIIDVLEYSAAILFRLAEATPPEVRGFHSAGMADAQGFVAMACDEILIHTHDIASGLGLAYQPPAELCEAVLRRLFPWAEAGLDPWPGLLWANGRAPLPGRDRQAADWYWQCAPLSEWDGTVRKRKPAP